MNDTVSVFGQVIALVSRDEFRRVATNLKVEHGAKGFTSWGHFVSMMLCCLSMFPWAKFRQTKGAVKLRTLLDHDGYLPVFVNVNDGKRHEVKAAWELSLPKGGIVAIDRGYIDYGLFRKWNGDGVFFDEDEGEFRVLDAWRLHACPGTLEDRRGSM